MAFFLLLCKLSRVLILLCIFVGNNPKGFPLLGTDTGCRERLTNPNGIITSPRFPNNYAINSLCVWIITLEDVNSIIKLKFDSFALEGHPLCRYDYLLIRDGDSQSSPVIGKYCGSSLPKEIRSTSNRLWLMLFSDSAFTGKGFRASYKHATKHRSAEEIIPSLTSAPVICGGFRSGDSGEITSPEYPTAYPKNAECMWTIQHPSSLIELSFETLDLEDTPQCQFDFVKIEDVGSTIRSLGKLCGTNVASDKLKFTGRKLRVTFKSDSSNSATGFKARWKSLRKQLDGKSKEGQECGGVKRGMVGFLRSNNYPENYNTNERCEWTILAAETGMNIQLRFADFNIEPSSNCEYDYLEVFDGESSASPSLGKFCGRQVPEMLQSTGDKIHVTFQTDNADTRPGFEIAWVAVFQPGLGNAAGVFRKARMPDTESCGGSFYSSEGTFETPSYPENYPARSLCTWVIQGRENSQIKLTFTTFDVEKHATCKYDHVVIRDGSTENSRMINTYCGDEIPSPVLSLSNSLWIQFKSDSSKQLNGFQASWKSVNRACGSRFSSKTGEISSPNYPAASTNRRFCTWIIDVPSAAKIRLKFKDIDIRSSSSCSYGYVQIFDGDSSQQPSLGRFCHSFLPRPIVSSGNKIMIGFQSDDSGRTRGFKAEWMSIEAKPTLPPVHSLPATPCGATLSQESGNIVLPRRVRSCKWLIKPSSGKRITLSVVKANLKPNPDCSKESLEIHNGFTSLAPLLLRICGRLQPQTVQSFTGVLRVEYHLQGEIYDQDVNLYWTTSQEPSKNDIRNQGSCGVIKVPQQRFVNDRAFVTSGSLPWIAALLSGSSSIYCGAAILSAKWVITAAHCFKRFSFNARRKIMVGELNLFETEGTEQEHNMKLIHIHPNYNPLTNENDIALINLEGKVTLNDKVNTVCLPSNKTNFQPGTVCSTGGWGTTRYLGRPSKPLVLARVPLVSSEVCNSTVAYRGSIKQDMVCAGNSDGGLDTCQGDGGGPLTCEIRPGKHILVGISSWGNGCASPNKYGVYTDVRKHLNWIESILTL